MSRIETPFGFSSTTADVTAGLDLSGQRVIVTGGSSGLGAETARALAAVGAEVTLAVRDLDAGTRAAETIKARPRSRERGPAVGHLGAPAGLSHFLSHPVGSVAGMSGTEQAAGTGPAGSSGQVVADYWAAAEARDWAAFGTLLADDVVYEAPQTRERVSGREAYIRFNAEGFPGDWHLAVRRIVSQDRAAVSMIQFSEGEVSQPGLCFFDLDRDGRIVRITDFWPDPYEAPAGRAHLAGRY